MGKTEKAKAREVPSFAITATDEAFEKVVRTYFDAVGTRFEMDDSKRARMQEELSELIEKGRRHQADFGIGKPKLDLSKRQWGKEK